MVRINLRHSFHKYRYIKIMRNQIRYQEYKKSNSIESLPLHLSLNKNESNPYLILIYKVVDDDQSVQN